MLARPTQRANTALALCFLEQVGIVARGNDLLGPLRELPLLEQPAADRRMVDAETLLLALDQCRLAPLLGAEAGVEIGNGVIERHDADVLYQAREEQLLAVLDADDARKHVARRRAKQRAPPVERVVEPARLSEPCQDFNNENDNASEIVAFKPMTISACLRFSVLRWRAYIGEFAIRRIFAVMAGSSASTSAIRAMSASGSLARSMIFVATPGGLGKLWQFSIFFLSSGVIKAGLSCASCASPVRRRRPIRPPSLLLA